VFITNGIHTLVNVIIVDPNKANLVLKVISFQGMVATIVA
jgi:hypothetical protein